MTLSASPPERTITLQEAIAAATALHQAGRLAEAAEIYRQVLDAVPGNPDALHLLGLVGLQQGDAATAVRLIGEATRIAPGNATAQNNLGAALLQLDRIEEAEAAFGRAIDAHAGYGEAHNNRGNAMVRLGRFDEALACYDRAIALGVPGSTVHYNRGIALQNLGRLTEALAAYEAALAREPDYADAHHNRGEALLALGRPAEALECYDREIALNGNRAGAHNARGVALMTLGRLDEAIASFDQAASLEPARVDALHNRGIALVRAQRLDDALASIERALAIDPGHAGARFNRAAILLPLARLDEALRECEAGLLREPGGARWHFLASVVLAEMGRLEEARDACTRAIAIDPDLPSAHGHGLYLRMRLCDWEGLDGAIAATLERVRAGKPAADPFTLVATPATLADRLQCAKTFVQHRFPAKAPPAPASRQPHDRLRVAYLSSDFQDHATAHLFAEVLERHDRSRFEITAVSYGAASSDPWRRRIEGAVERFLDVAVQADDAVAGRLRELGIDIAVDLKGFTTGCRTGILARRPAPVQVNYLGYPGSMGAPYIDYLIADSTVVDAGHAAFYSERIVLLPHSYQPNPSSRAMAEGVPSRAALGLPEGAFVFCCFNNNYKITPEVFRAWMRLLAAVPGSVLWLLEGHPAAAANLRREAMALGVAQERLVFAPRIDIAQHLARHGAADLFLDTVPCNAHTTASDALWAGLPVVTVLGDAFPGRVAASLLRAVGLPELVANSLPDYEALARRLAGAPAELAKLRARLAAHRSTHPLFDTPAYTRHLEAAFATMGERHARGAAPESFAVPA
ncbi:MAG: tetratricopeptide repeat protein [Betaproteobacteria bacterium]|nr:tetratricopeptide repeat protein [Betaproteobacteria bacterium]